MRGGTHGQQTGLAGAQRALSVTRPLTVRITANPTAPYSPRDPRPHKPCHPSQTPHTAPPPYLDHYAFNRKIWPCFIEPTLKLSIGSTLLAGTAGGGRAGGRHLGGGRDHVPGQPVVLAHAVSKRVAAVLARARLVVRPQRGVRRPCAPTSMRAWPVEVVRLRLLCTAHHGRRARAPASVNQQAGLAGAQRVLSVTRPLNVRITAPLPPHSA